MIKPATWNLSEAIEMGQKIQTEFERIFRQEADRFVDWKKLIKRFERALKSLKHNDPESYCRIDEIHNEMCVAYVLLTSNNSKIDKILYEPQIPGISKTIDFGYTAEGKFGYVDVKTICPRPLDHWDKFESALKNGYFPDYCTFSLTKEHGGGLIWHDITASRNKMLDYTRELEEKIDSISDAIEDISILLVFCGNGFNWSCSDLENFVEYYWLGKHSAFDRLAKMEVHHIEVKAIKLNRLINCFGYMKRRFQSMYPDEIKWIYPRG